MKFEVSTQAAEKARTDLLVLPLFSDEGRLSPEAKRLDVALAGKVSALRRGKDFAGEAGEQLVLFEPKGVAAKRLMLVGLGEKKKFDSESLRVAASLAGKLAGKSELREIAFAARRFKGMSPALQAKALVEGSLIGSYSFEKHKTKKKKSALRTIRAAGVAREDATAMKAGGGEGVITSRCINFARDLVNDPANYVTPAYLAGIARRIARQYRMKCRVYSRREAAKMKMGSFLAVAKGSDTPPCFIALDYNPAGAKETVVIIGKGLTFDSGGINLKTGDFGSMKGDMAGAAAVMGIVAGAGEMRLKRRVIGLVPATENMPGGHATRPGDIVKSMAGKTIEIINTDAEGRMTLVDALTFAERYKPDAVFDFATLTGSCQVALGDSASGLFGNNEKLISLVEEASKETGERVWHLPMWDEFNDMMKGDLSDLKNGGGRGGGASSAAAFLSNFAGKYPWVHLDIAGPRILDKPYKYLGKGGTGVPVRLMLNLLRNFKLPKKA